MSNPVFAFSPSELNRKWIGIELDERWIDTIKSDGGKI